MFCSETLRIRVIGGVLCYDTAQNMIFSVTYYLELCNAIIVYYASRFFYQPWSNWLFGHCRTLTCLLGKIVH